jgi:DNA-binding CsgD family transcriptional regulator
MSRKIPAMHAGTETVMKRYVMTGCVDEAALPLTRVEISCLTRIANGIPPGAIGNALGISTREVEILLHCAERKLGAKNRLHAVATAIERGLIGIHQEQG